MIFVNKFCSNISVFSVFQFSEKRNEKTFDVNKWWQLCLLLLHVLHSLRLFPRMVESISHALTQPKAFPNFQFPLCVEAKSGAWAVNDIMTQAAHENFDPTYDVGKKKLSTKITKRNP